MFSDLQLEIGVASLQKTQSSQLTRCIAVLKDQSGFSVSRQGHRHFLLIATPTTKEREQSTTVKTEVKMSCQ